jgi:hypothetical protein
MTTALLWDITQRMVVIPYREVVPKRRKDYTQTRSIFSCGIHVNKPRFRGFILQNQSLGIA